jgi:2-oxoacid:acceptor oxidoreductase delta subunit (pyruvate/2-ketoisovalerate family)
VPKNGHGFEFQPDTILTAIGEVADLTYAGDLMPADGVFDVDRGMAVKKGMNAPLRIFAGGDIVDSPRTVVHAVAAGKRAAIAMDCLRRGDDVNTILNDISIGHLDAISFSHYRDTDRTDTAFQNRHKVVGREALVYDYFDKAESIEIRLDRPEDRKGHFGAFHHTYSEGDAFKEAARCLHCGRCTECDNCLIFCPDMSILCKSPEDHGYTIDYDYCKGCSICANECPRNAITMVDEEP